MEEPTIVSPESGTTFKANQTVRFEGECYDPDLRNGQVLNLTWSSDISGVIGYGPSFELEGMIPGNHTITLTVRDGEYTMSTNVRINVVSMESSGGDDDGDGPSVGGGTGALMIIVIVLVLVIIVVDVAIVARRRMRSRQPEVEDQALPDTIVADVGPSPDQPAAGGTAQDQFEWIPPPTPDYPTEGAPGVSGTAPAPEVYPSTPYEPSEVELEPYAAPLPVPEPPPMTTDVPGMDPLELAEAREEREVMKALNQLPHGLPNTLWSWDMVALSRRIISGEKRTAPNGTQLVNVDGKWYEADRTNVERFMREYTEPVPSGEPSSREEYVRDKLDKLEDALLDGRISEETYKELKAKYE
jgi:hypothetical protein